MVHSHRKFYPALKYKWTVTKLSEIKDMLVARRANEKDNMILITGARGDGKTTFAGKIAFQCEDFDPYESIIYTKEGMFKLLRKKNGIIWADEGVVNAAKGNVMTRANKLLFEASTINRDNFNIVFFLMPFVEDFDSKILQYISMWIHIDSRGLGVMMLPTNKGIFGKRNWDLTAMKKLFDEFQKENMRALHVPYWIFPNFRGYVKFGKLTIQQDTIVKEIKSLRKNENLSQEMQAEVEVQVKSLDNYTKYSAKKLAEEIIKGGIRDVEQFNRTCEGMKLDPVLMLKRCESIFRANGVPETVKQTFKKYTKEDNLIQF